LESDEEDSIDKAVYCAPSTRGAGTGQNLTPGGLEKPDTEGMSKVVAKHVIKKWGVVQKQERDKEHHMNAAGKAQTIDIESRKCPYQSDLNHSLNHE
jgi:hypothetical protein